MNMTFCKTTMIGCILTAVLLAGCERDDKAAAPTNATTPSAANSERCPHEIKREKCPFCTPSLIESDGFCGAHGVAEALCYQCRPYLSAAFRAKGDWCAEHKAPESQCVVCHPELKENVRPGEHGAHTPS